MSKKNESTNKPAIETLVEQVETLEDRKGRMVKAIRLNAVQGEEAEREAAEKIKGKYPNALPERGVFILIEESKRAVFTTCGHEGCGKELGLTRTSDLFQVNRCSEHRVSKGGKSKGGNKALFEALAERL